MNKRPTTEIDKCDTKWSTEGTGNLVSQILGQLQFFLQCVFTLLGNIIQSLYCNN